MKTIHSNADNSRERMEQLRYESFLNAIEEAFKQNKTGIRHTDKAMLQFADQIIRQFAAIYANTRNEELGKDAQEIILGFEHNYN